MIVSSCRNIRFNHDFVDVVVAAESTMLIQRSRTCQVNYYLTRLIRKMSLSFTHEMPSLFNFTPSIVTTRKWNCMAVLLRIHFISVLYGKISFVMLNYALINVVFIKQMRQKWFYHKIRNNHFI